MRAQYSKRVAPFLLGGVLAAIAGVLVVRQLPFLADLTRPMFTIAVFVLWGFGFANWALAKGHTQLHFLWALFPFGGLLVLALLKDKFRDTSA